MSDQTSAVRPAVNGTAGTPDAGTGSVRNRRTEVSEYVHREILLYGLGEPYRYDVVPVCAPTGPDGLEVGYVLYVSTALPVPIGSRVAIASKPFEFDADEPFVQRVVRAALDQLRTAVRSSLGTGGQIVSSNP